MRASRGRRSGGSEGREIRCARAPGSRSAGNDRPAARDDSPRGSPSNIPSSPHPLESLSLHTYATMCMNTTCLSDRKRALTYEHNANITTDPEASGIDLDAACVVQLWIELGKSRDVRRFRAPLRARSCRSGDHPPSYRPQQLDRNRPSAARRARSQARRGAGAFAARCLFTFA